MAQDHDRGQGAEPEIDEGFRAWYRTCPCCLSEAYPEVKRALDEESAGRSARATQER